MTRAHWFWIPVLLGNAIGIYPAWQAGSPVVMLFCFSVGWSLATLTNLPEKGVGTPTPQERETP